MSKRIRSQHPLGVRFQQPVRFSDKISLVIPSDVVGGGRPEYRNDLHSTFHEAFHEKITNEHTGPVANEIFSDPRQLDMQMVDEEVAELFRSNRLSRAASPLSIRSSRRESFAFQDAMAIDCSSANNSVWSEESKYFLMESRSPSVRSFRSMGATSMYSTVSNIWNDQFYDDATKSLGSLRRQRWRRRIIYPPSSRTPSVRTPVLAPTLHTLSRSGFEDDDTLFRGFDDGLSVASAISVSSAPAILQPYSHSHSAEHLCQYPYLHRVRQRGETRRRHDRGRRRARRSPTPFAPLVSPTNSSGADNGLGSGGITDELSSGEGFTDVLLDRLLPEGLAERFAGVPSNHIERESRLFPGLMDLPPFPPMSSSSSMRDMDPNRHHRARYRSYSPSRPVYRSLSPNISPTLSRGHATSAANYPPPIYPSSPHYSSAPSFPSLYPNNHLAVHHERSPSASTLHALRSQSMRYTTPRPPSLPPASPPLTTSSRPRSAPTSRPLAPSSASPSQGSCPSRGYRCDRHRRRSERLYSRWRSSPMDLWWLSSLPPAASSGRNRSQQKFSYLSTTSSRRNFQLDMPSPLDDSFFASLPTFPSPSPVTNNAPQLNQGPARIVYYPRLPPRYRIRSHSCSSTYHFAVPKLYSFRNFPASQYPLFAKHFSNRSPGWSRISSAQSRRGTTTTSARLDIPVGSDSAALTTAPSLPPMQKPVRKVSFSSDHPSNLFPVNACDTNDNDRGNTSSAKRSSVPRSRASSVLSLPLLPFLPPSPPRLPSLPPSPHRSHTTPFCSLSLPLGTPTTPYFSQETFLDSEIRHWSANFFAQAPVMFLHPSYYLFPTLQSSDKLHASTLSHRCTHIRNLKRSLSEMPTIRVLDCTTRESLFVAKCIQESLGSFHAQPMPLCFDVLRANSGRRVTHSGSRDSPGDTTSKVYASPYSWWQKHAPPKYPFPIPVFSSRTYRFDSVYNTPTMASPLESNTLDEFTPLTSASHEASHGFPLTYPSPPSSDRHLNLWGGVGDPGPGQEHRGRDLGVTEGSIRTRALPRRSQTPHGKTATSLSLSSPPSEGTALHFSESTHQVAEGHDVQTPPGLVPKSPPLNPLLPLSGLSSNLSSNMSSELLFEQPVHNSSQKPHESTRFYPFPVAANDSVPLIVSQGTTIPRAFPPPPPPPSKDSIPQFPSTLAVSNTVQSVLSNPKSIAPEVVSPNNVMSDSAKPNFRIRLARSNSDGPSANSVLASHIVAANALTEASDVMALRKGIPQPMDAVYNFLAASAMTAGAAPAAASMALPIVAATSAASPTLATPPITSPPAAPAVARSGRTIRPPAVFDAGPLPQRTRWEPGKCVRGRGRPRKLK